MSKAASTTTAQQHLIEDALHTLSKINASGKVSKFREYVLSVLQGGSLKPNSVPQALSLSLKQPEAKAAVADVVGGVKFLQLLGFKSSATGDGSLMQLHMDVGQQRLLAAVARMLRGAEQFPHTHDKGGALLNGAPLPVGRPMMPAMQLPKKKPAPQLPKLDPAPPPASRETCLVVPGSSMPPPSACSALADCAVIRVRMPDSRQAQGVFAGGEPVERIRAWLEQEVLPDGGMHFELRHANAPLAPGWATIAQCGLAPLGMLTLHPAGPASAPTPPQYVRQKLLDEAPAPPPPPMAAAPSPAPTPTTSPAAAAPPSRDPGSPPAPADPPALLTPLHLRCHLALVSEVCARNAMLAYAAGSGDPMEVSAANKHSLFAVARMRLPPPTFTPLLTLLPAGCRWSATLSSAAAWTRCWRR